MRAVLNMLTVLALSTAVVMPMVVSVPPAHAEDAITRTAKRYFANGEKLFALGKFDEALEQYQQAFEAKPLPGFLYNIGQCYRNLGNFDQAIFSFRKYVALEPDAPNKEAVQRLIDDLEERKAREEGQKRIGTPPPVSASGKPAYKKWWFWTGLTAVAAAGGTTAYILTREKGAPSTTLGDITINR